MSSNCQAALSMNLLDLHFYWKSLINAVLDSQCQYVYSTSDFHARNTKYSCNYLPFCE